MVGDRAHPTTQTYDAVLFDLLTALLDSWTLWNEVAGSAEAGYRWRAEYLKNTYAAGRYRPYEDLVGEAARNVGLPFERAHELGARYAELEPWPEVRETLRALHEAGIALGVVTNCSERLGRIAADRIGVPFSVFVTAERAGYYKPQPQPYQLALDELPAGSKRCLFVAGSGYDLFGTVRVGLPTWWHNRAGMTLPEGAPAPIVIRRDMTTLPAFVLGHDMPGRPAT
ncbi:HAD-IA family hydrolase [Bradyrhizobium sp. LTSP885]|uniref:HAD-IA family hydrolase n=1 Tax=Bradyrhizobium sp. LTSP885 TaxID=1619232 RepID=UPI0005CAAA06|nr:HAD-IA family hydrolase [Bradyrhizobium sp. LTSP885]